jgi:hypothetical protein
MTVKFMIAAVYLSLIALAAAASSYADTVYLNNGGKISGKIVKDDGSTVTVDIGGGTVVQNKSDIARIKKEEEVLLPIKESEAIKQAEQESATPMLDTKKDRKGIAGMVGGIVDTAFSILKFDFLKKDK